MTTPLPSDPLLERLRQATLGLYEIRDELGRGGMAVVYMAKDLRLQRPVAIKVMMPALLHAEGMTDRFLQEARIAAQLQHPNIIIVHDVQQQDDLLYFVMNLVEGATIDELLRASPFTIMQVRWILSSAARGLAHAHSEGVIHRDVKPGNLLVNVKGDVIVTDFGIAKATDSVRMTQTGMAIGTPVYMSPEQVTGATGLSAASDQYSLGIAAYEMIAGAPPFTGDTAFALQVAHVQREPADVMTKRSDCPPDLAFIVHRMLAKSPEERWSSLDEVSALASAALPFGGGDARKELAGTARALHDRRGLSTAVFGVRTPRSPLPRPDVAKERTSGSVTTLVLTPPESHLHVSGKVRLHSLAVVNGQDSGEHRATWMSTDPSVAVVTEEGEVLGIAAGRAEIIAINQFGEARATIEVVSMPVPVAPLLDTPAPVVKRVDTPAPVIHTMSVDINPSHLAMEGGDAIPLTVKVRDMRGSIVSDPVVEWHSDAPRVAFVDDRGTVAALSVGRATITATVDGVTARASIEVGSTWRTQNSLEQLSVKRPPPTPPPVAPPVAPPIAAPIFAPVPRKEEQSDRSPPVADTPTRKAPAVAPAGSPTKSRSRVLVGAGVALVAIVAAVWAFMTPGDTVTSVAVDSRAGQEGDSVTAVPPFVPPPDTAREAVAIADTQAVQKKETPSTPPPAPRNAERPAPRSAPPGVPARAPAGESELRVDPKPTPPPNIVEARTTVIDSVAKPPVTTQGTEKPAPPIVTPPAAPTIPPPSTGVNADAGRAAPPPAPSPEVSAASAVRDLNAQLQRKAVLVGPLKSFFQLGSDHVARIIGAPQVISASGGSVSASVSVEVMRTGPSGNIERRRTQITFNVLGTGANATAQATSASSLQRP